MKPTIKIEQLFPFDVINTYVGIFTRLQDTTTYPLLADFITSSNAKDLDFDYHIGHSAEKRISPLYVKYVEKGCDLLSLDIEDVIDGTMSAFDLYRLNDVCLKSDNANIKSGLCAIIYNRFGVKWKKLYDALNTQYNPLENYDMTQERTPDIVHEDVYDVTDERTADLTDTENGQISKNVDSENGVYGFNSTGANPSDNNSGNETTNINNHTTATSGTDTNVKSGSITSSETGSEKLTRHGNIGVTSSQQLLESEFEVRKKDFYKIIYNDIDSVLCLKCY